MLTKKAFWLVGAMSIILGGLGVGTAAAMANKEVEPVQALSETTVTYICRITKANGITTLPGGMWAHAWNGLDTGDVAMTQVSSNENEKVFSVDLSIDYTSILFKDAADWSGKQTVNLDTGYVRSIASPYSVEYAITDLSANYSGAFVNHSYPTFNSSYCRIWGDPSTTSYTYGYSWTIHYWNDALTINKEIPAKGFCNLATGTGNRWAGYFDVPTEIIGCHRQAKVYGPTGAYVNATNDDVSTYVSGDNAYLFYITGTSPLYLTEGIAAKESAAQSIPAAVIATVLEGYFTCSPDMDNGYGNFQTLTTNWIHNFAEPQVWWISGNMSGVTINDFDGSAANTSVYATGTPRTTSTDLQTKYDRMTALYDSAHGVGSFGFSSSETGTNSSMFLLISAGCLGAVAIYFFLKKKRVSLA